MEKDPSLKIKKSIEESIRIKNLIIKKETYKVLEEIGDLMVSSIKDGGKIMLCGNGGSAADAQHLTAEFLIRLTSDVNREGIPAISLVQDSSTFTAAINDFDPKELFKRNFITLAKKQDVLLAISTSGNSENIFEALKAAKEMGIKSVGFLGNGGGICLPFCNLSFVVPSDKTARIQEAHIMGGHVLIEYIEAKLIKDGFLNLS